MVFRELFRVTAALRCRAAALLALRGGGKIAPLRCRRRASGAAWWWCSIRVALFGAAPVRYRTCVPMVFHELFRANAPLQCRAAALVASLWRCVAVVFRENDYL